MRMPRSSGVSLVEVLVTVVILAFGLLGIAAFQAKAQLGAVEGYGRAQGIVLLQDMRARLAGNAIHAAEYVTDTPLGTGDAQPADCAAAAAGSDRDKCEWSHALKGAGAASATGTATADAGAMIGARGCIEEVQARSETAGACRPGIYRVTVAWQGLHATKAPALACGRGAYGADTGRRAIAVRVAVPTPSCS